MKRPVIDFTELNDELKRQHYEKVQDEREHKMIADAVAVYGDEDITYSRDDEYICSYYKQGDELEDRTRFIALVNGSYYDVISEENGAHVLMNESSIDTVYNLLQKADGITLSIHSDRFANLEHAYVMDLAGTVTDVIKSHDPKEFAEKVKDESMFCVNMVDSINKGDTQLIEDMLDEFIQECEKDDDFSEACIYAHAYEDLKNFRENRFLDKETNEIRPEFLSDECKPSASTLKDRLFNRVKEATNKAYGVTDVEVNGPQQS